MKFIAAATALFAGLAAAAPSDKAARSQYVTLEFWAAADNTYALSVPVNGGEVTVSSDLSFSHITSYSSGNTVCTAYGIDGSVTELDGSEVVDIGPPQVQLSAVCTSS